MKFRQTTGMSIQEKFNKFDEENPIVYSLFKKQVFRAISKRKSKVSAKTILGFIRWEVQLQTTGDVYKINDVFTSRYARKFSEEFEQYKDIFNFRTLRS